MVKLKHGMLTGLVAVSVCVIGQPEVRSQGLSQNQTTGLVAQTVAGVRFETLPGFTIERINPADRRDSYVVVTFDSLGRLVVSKEGDHPRILLDNDGDGTYESEKVITDQVRNCQGLWFEERTLYGSCEIPPPSQPDPPAAAAGGPGAAGQGGGAGRQGGGRGPIWPAAIVRLPDANADDVADSRETLGMAGRIEEHGPHAIRRSPDGGWMVIVGNNQTIADPAVDLTSPVLSDKDGQFLPYLPNFGSSSREGAHSAIFAWHERTKQFSVFSGGNRNAYDFAFNAAGEAFLFDSDMEWDIGMPWYREVRTVHQIPNGNYGYRNGSGKYPAWYIDSLPPVRDLGRGSPVGVEIYSSYAYPREYFDTLFEADWSRGRLLYTALMPQGATYRARDDRAEFVHGEPFNITDVEVGPDGLLYFTTGGRNTVGGVWRLRYTGTAPPRPDMTGILAVVRQPQPLSSWGWAAIERVKSSMGAAFGTELERLARNGSASADDRARAIYELQRHGPAPTAALLSALITDRTPAVRAAVAYVAGFQNDAARADAAKIAATGLRDADPLVRRRSAEALLRLGQSPDRASLAPVADLLSVLNDADRFTRWAGRIALEHTPRADWKDRVLAETNPLGTIEGMLAWVRTAKGEPLQPVVDRSFALLKQSNLSTENKLRLYRLVMYTTTELPSGLSAEQRRQLHGFVAAQFPAKDERLNRELALLLAYAGQSEGISEILAAMPPGNENQALQLHYLYALRTVKQGWTPAQKATAAEMFGRTSRWRGGAQFTNFLGQMFDQLAEVYTTDAEKEVLYAKAPDFAPLTPAEIAALQARGGGAGRAGRGGPPPAAAPAGTTGRGQPPATAGAAPAAPARGAGGGGRGRGGAPIQTRTQGRTLNKGEIFDEVIYTPRTGQPNADAGRAVFVANCASCHRAGAIGNDHGVASLNLTASASKTARRDLLESIMFPSRAIRPEHETTVVTKTDGTTESGLLIGETAQGLTLLRANGTTVVVPKPVRSQRKERTTIMTDAITDAMNQGQLGNLLAFLQGAGAP